MQTSAIDVQLDNLLIYRSMLNDSLVRKMQAVLKGADESSILYEMYGGLIEKAETLGLSGNIWKGYVTYLLSHDENIFSTTVVKNKGVIGLGLHRAVLHDLAIIYAFLNADITKLRSADFIISFPCTADRCAKINPVAQLLPSAENDGYFFNILADNLIKYYLKYGYGKIAGYAAFRWDEKAGLTGVKSIDDIHFDDIVCYEKQKQILMKNTENFLANKPANNVLLVGARGTGKSSSVKALVNKYSTSGLKLVEVQKHQMRFLPDIINELRDHNQYFIIFLDDLSFEETETEYKGLKSVIEGSIEAQPSNVLLYATSNRRHLIKENWSDRADMQDIHSADSIHEKISLSDRFGITLTFPAPDQDEYLRIVETLAKQHGIRLPEAELKSRALRWELSHSGRSGRVARQFVWHLAGNG